jgi:hypothetical protein
MGIVMRKLFYSILARRDARRIADDYRSKGYNVSRYKLDELRMLACQKYKALS